MKKFRYDMPSAVMRILVGLILMGFGVTVIVYFGIEDKRCSAEVTGTVIRIETQQIRSRTEYRPVFEYEYNGQVYTFNGYYDRSNYSSSASTEFTGDTYPPTATSHPATHRLRSWRIR